MHKLLLVLLSALLFALCVPQMHAGDASGKKTVRKQSVKKTKSSGKKKTSNSTTNKTGPTAPDQTTITPGGSPNSGTQTSYDPKKGRRYPAPPKKKKP